MPHINVQMLSGRTVAQKSAMIAELAAAIRRTLGVLDEAIRILLTEIPPENWGGGGRSMTRLRAAPAADPESDWPAPVIGDGSDRLFTGPDKPVPQEESMSTGDQTVLIERASAFPFNLTVQRLTTAITDAGMTVFAVIDHAENGLPCPRRSSCCAARRRAGRRSCWPRDTALWIYRCGCWFGKTLTTRR